MKLLWKHWQQQLNQSNWKTRWINYSKGLQWRLVVIFALLLAIAMQIIFATFSSELETYFKNKTSQDLYQQAELLKRTVPKILTDYRDDQTELQNKLKAELENLVYLRNKDKTLIDVQIVDSTGLVIASTPISSSRIGQKNIRASKAIPDGTYDIRRDPSHKDIMTVVQTLYDSNRQNYGRIYMEYPLDTTYSTIRSIVKILIKKTAIALVAASILIIILTRTITVPVKEIKEQATAMAEGDFNRHVHVRSTDEIGKLAKAFNHLASHLRVALAQKEEEREKLETVLADMSDGVIATDRQGLIIVKNERAELILNKKISLNQKLNDILPMAEPIAFPVLEERHTLVELSSDDLDEHSFIKLTFTPLRRKNSETVGLIVVLKDVTEEERLDRQRKDFVANVSHELRTPLTTIKSYLEALEDGAIHQPELANRFLQVSRTEADRMTRLINDLLQLSRLDAKQSRFNKKVMYLEDILEDVADRFVFQCKQKNIKLSLRHGDFLPRVYADRDKMDQVLDNLLSNAVKFTPEGGSISISSRRRSDGMAEVAISDSGIGIPKKDLDRIFERFYRVDKARSRQQGGTGLGLAIVQEIIHAHEGTVWIESNYQKGTTVFFALPPCEPEVRT